MSKEKKENWEKEFDKEMVEPDTTNAGRSSPKMWMFEGYISAKKEAKSFIRSLLSSHISSVLKEIVKGINQLKKEQVGDPEECDYCGCTDEDACEGGCEWAATGVCSNCAEKDCYWQLGFEKAIDLAIKKIKEK